MCVFKASHVLSRSGRSPHQSYFYQEYLFVRDLDPQSSKFQPEKVERYSNGSDHKTPELYRSTSKKPSGHRAFLHMHITLSILTELVFNKLKQFMFPKSLTRSRSRNVEKLIKINDIKMRKVGIYYYEKSSKSISLKNYNC